MSQEQQFLTPDQQDKLFKHLKDIGALSQDVGQSPASQDEPAQSGIGNVDFATLQSLFKHASNPNAVSMQEGDKIHPMDAISQIGGQMFGPKNSGADLATGPQVSQSPQGFLSAKIPSSNFILKKLGVGKDVPLSNANYYPAAKQAGIDKFLPSGLARMPDGTPYVDADTFSKVLVAQRTMVGQGNEIYTTKDQLLAQGLPEDVASHLMASAIGAGKPGVSNKEITNYLGTERISAARTMADARATMAGVAKLGQALKVGGFEAAQPMAERANQNLLLGQKAQALIDQIVAQGGKANIRQQAELGRNMAALVATNSGVVTDEGMNSMIPNTAMKKYGGWKEYLTNEQEPVDFTGFLPQMQDLLTREKTVNLGMSNAASQLGINIMSGTGQPGQATTITNARNQTPVFGNNAPTNQIVTPPGAQNTEMIRVRNIKTRQTGNMPKANFNPSIYQQL